MNAPNRHAYPIGPDGNLKAPTTDAEARACGLEKLEHVATGDIVYRHSVDRKELERTGEYVHHPWPQE